MKAFNNIYFSSIGYDAYDVGPLAEGWRYQPDTAAYGQPYVAPGSEFPGPGGQAAARAAAEPRQDHAVGSCRLVAGVGRTCRSRPAPAHAWRVAEPAREPGRSRPFGGVRDPARVVAFSDAVIAIAITLLVLEIRPPRDTAHLLRGLAALWPSYLAYGLTFMLIGQVWANHHVMFDQIRIADRVVLFLNTVLLMDIAFLPFAAAVLAQAFREGEGQRTAIALHGTAFELAAILFNVIWWYARRHRELLTSSLDFAGARAIARRFQLALAWIATGTLMGVVLPALGVAVIAAFIPYYWLPIRGEIARAKSRRDGGGQA